MDKHFVVVVKGIIVKDNKILILKRSGNDDIDPGTWEFVGGKVEFGEELEDSLQREIKEEAGIDVKIEKLLYATTVLTSQNRHVVIITFLCTSQTDSVVLSGEHSAHMWVTKDEMKEKLNPAILMDMDRRNIFSLI